MGSASPHSPSDVELAAWRIDYAARYAQEMCPDSALIEQQRLALKAIRFDSRNNEPIKEDIEAYHRACAIWTGPVKVSGVARNSHLEVANAKANGYSVGRDGDTVLCSYNPGTDEWFAWHVGYQTGAKDRAWREAKRG